MSINKKGPIGQLEPFEKPCFVIVWAKYGYFYVEEYDIKSLYPMFLKCYHHLHPWAKSQNIIVD